MFGHRNTYTWLLQCCSLRFRESLQLPTVWKSYTQYAVISESSSHALYHSLHRNSCPFKTSNRIASEKDCIFLLTQGINLLRVVRINRDVSLIQSRFQFVLKGCFISFGCLDKKLFKPKQLAVRSRLLNRERGYYV